jgi:DNA-binding response OmpR family regulator
LFSITYIVLILVIRIRKQLCMVILLLDKSQHITDRLVNYISEARYDVIFQKAITYTDAMAMLDEYKPEAVIMDINFPGPKAIELLQTIKASNDKTVIIVLFSIADDFMLKQLKEHGAHFLFDKYKEFEKIPSTIVAIQANR